ncbi:unnamed protein product [Lactuca virosa]|uniref:Uncharacterized protein n=1 Tax=Lactuca virosa TaxID=75947 RepID=A0AAU9PFR4_9ASTR|nr:unnamed protein product [Lactuca virosa]
MSVQPKLKPNDGASSSVGVSVGGRCRCRRLPAFSVLPQYLDSGDCDRVCEFCGAYFWYVERVLKFSTPGHPRYNHCCRGGDVVLPYVVIGTPGGRQQAGTATGESGVGLNVLHKSLYQGIIVSLDLSANHEKQSPSQNDAQKLEVKFKSLESQAITRISPYYNKKNSLEDDGSKVEKLLHDAGFSGGGLLIQSEMQHGPVNMVAGAQNVNGVAVGGLEGYLGNSRFSY